MIAASTDIEEVLLAGGYDRELERQKFQNRLSKQTVKQLIKRDKANKQKIEVLELEKKAAATEKNIERFQKEAAIAEKEIARIYTEVAREEAVSSTKLLEEFESIKNQKGSQKKAKQIKKFPSPDGLQWGEVAMSFTSDKTIEVRGGRIIKEFRYDEIGFQDQRSGDPSQLWMTLRAFALKGGSLSWLDLSRKSSQNDDGTVDLDAISIRVKQDI